MQWIDHQKPEEWSDEDDGEWIAPQVPNPLCQTASGCGPWKRPEIPNRRSLQAYQLKYVCRS